MASGVVIRSRWRWRSSSKAPTLIRRTRPTVSRRKWAAPRAVLARPSPPDNEPPGHPSASGCTARRPDTPGRASLEPGRPGPLARSCATPSRRRRAPAPEGTGSSPQLPRSETPLCRKACSASPPRARGSRALRQSPHTPPGSLPSSTPRALLSWSPPWLPSAP